MGGSGDGAAVQRKAQLRLLSTVPAVRLQDSSERTAASRIAHYQVPEVWRGIRRDGWQEAAEHVVTLIARYPTHIPTWAKGTVRVTEEWSGERGFESSDSAVTFPSALNNPSPQSCRRLSEHPGSITSLRFEGDPNRSKSEKLGLGSWSSIGVFDSATLGAIHYMKQVAGEQY